MKIDRARFLLVTAALAATGCTVNNNVAATPDGSVADSSSGAEAGGDTGMSSDAGTEAAACDDSVIQGAKTNCGDFGPDGSADAGCPLVSSYCEGFQANLKPRVGQKTLNCLTSLTSCAEGRGILECLTSALGEVCDDSTAAATCTEIQTACASANDGGGEDAGVSAAECQRLVRGVNAGGRQKLVNCVKQDCSGGFVQGCLMVVSQP